MKTDQKQVTPLSPEQMHQWENDGYLLLKGVIQRLPSMACATALPVS